jgi:hypothetical protein
LYVDQPLNPGGGKFSNYYGVYIRNPSAVTGAYGLYSAGGKNYFGGNVGIGTTTPGANLEVDGTSKFDGAITFASGQTFPIPAGGVTDAMLANPYSGVGSCASGTAVTGLTRNAAPTCTAVPGTGTVTSVGSGAGLMGGPITTSGTLSIATGGVTNAMLANPSLTVTAGTDLTGGGSVALGNSVTLNLDTTKVPTLGAANIFGASQTISNGDLNLPATTTGATAGVISVGGIPLIHACCPNSSQNTFVGNAGNFSANASTDLGFGQNVGIGYYALQALTSGYDNTASGYGALSGNTTGSYNTAVGTNSGYYDNYGNILPSTGSNSTFIGANAAATANGLTNATAIGYGAQVAESNALVLGQTGTYVGIGTSSPAALLDVEGGTAASGNGVSGLQLVAQAGGANNISGGTAGNGGTIALTGGAGGADNSGSGNGGGGGGAIVITGGNGGPENNQTSLSNAGNGGSVTIQGGQGGSGPLPGITGNVLLAPSGGSVGIGTTTPGVMLDINSLNGDDFLRGFYSGTQRFHVDAFGNFYGNTFHPGGADFAESVAVRGSPSEYEPGDVLVIERGAHRRLTLSSTPYSTLVAGIYSTKPGVLATPHRMDDEQLKQEVALAVVGIVPCKVTAENGAIEEGDLLVTSSRAGYAMKGTDRSQMLGAVVGKALEPLPEGTGVIQVLVTLQ